MDKLIRFLGLLDWIVAGVTIIVGLVMSNPWILAAGCIGLCTAYFQPAKRFRAYLEKKFVRKRDTGEASTEAVKQDEAFYAEVLGQAQSVEADEAPAASVDRTYASPAVAYRGVYLSRNKHNMLKPEHLQLFREPSKDQFF